MHKSFPINDLSLEGNMHEGADQQIVKNNKLNETQLFYASH